MKYVISVIKKVCLGFFGLYSFNILFSNIDFSIPMNIYSLFMSSFFGIFGIITIVILKLLI